MREVPLAAGRLSGCDVRDALHLPAAAGLPFSEKLSAATAVHMKFDKVHWLVRIHHQRRKGRKAAVCKLQYLVNFISRVGRGIKKPGQGLLMRTWIGLEGPSQEPIPRSAAKSPLRLILA